jgi:hypothetical protein
MELELARLALNKLERRLLRLQEQLKLELVLSKLVQRLSRQLEQQQLEQQQLVLEQPILELALSKLELNMLLLVQHMLSFEQSLVAVVVVEHR